MVFLSITMGMSENSHVEKAKALNRKVNATKRIDEKMASRMLKIFKRDRKWRLFLLLVKAYVGKRHLSRAFEACILIIGAC